MAETKTRADLELFFSAGKIPTQSNFANLIASAVNQKDDGLQKSGDTALKIQAPVNLEAGANAPKELILFYDKFDDAAAKWKIGSRAGGFEIGRGIEPDFLINSGGSVGIGTKNPLGMLSIGDSSVDGSDGTLVIGAKKPNGTRQLKIGYDDKFNFVIGDYGYENANLNWIPQFAVHWAAPKSSFYINHDGNIGIRATTAGYPLTFEEKFGGKISLWGNTGVNYGFGVQKDTLEIYTREVGADVAFGYGSSGSLTETMRIKGNGSVGIGTATPAGRLNISEGSGTAGSSSQGTIVIDHENNGGASSIVFRSKVNRGSDYGYIQFQDASTVGGTGESARLIIGIENDPDDHLILKPSGNVGIGTNKPLGPLSIGDSAIENSDGFIVIGKNKGGSRHTRIGYDKNFNFVIGDYGNSNTEDKWIPQFAINWQAQGNSLYINEKGNVGIGTTSPTRAKLEISEGIDTTVRGYGFLNHDGPGHTPDSYTSSYSIWATKRIAAEEFNATSDARIKNIQGCSDRSADLAALLKIEVTDYRYKDVIGKDDAPHKKLIAQQVEKVFPQAVSKVTDVVPDIYQQASFADGWLELATDLKKGERVRLISGTTDGVYEVLETADGKFRTDFNSETDEVFVFGREVDDFRVVDYDAVSMLNVSATQELYKQVQELKEKVKLLESRKYAAIG